MAFDFTKLTGYSETMTAEEKLGLLATYEPPTPDLTGFIKKDTFDKTASELAEAKRLLKTKMTEDEQKEIERAASEAAVKAELEALRKENAVTKTKAQFLGLGYDEKLAADTAAALAGGDMDKVFANQKIHIETIKKIERAAALAGDQNPPAGAGARTTDFSKEIAEAQANSDYGLAAMLMRQQQEPTMQK